MTADESARTVKQAYHAVVDAPTEGEEIPLGPWTSDSLVRDPKHLSFVLARYKFCARMLEGKEHVIEIGCGDGFGLPIVADAVGKVTCVDWDERLLEGNRRRLRHLTNVEYVLADVNAERPDLIADGAYSIDVIEHVEPDSEDAFWTNVVDCLAPTGVLVTGTPNATAAAYASPQSTALHINLKTMQSLRAEMERRFENVFCFGQNDEVVHTGYPAMSHYIWTVAAGKRRQRVD